MTIEIDINLYNKEQQIYMIAEHRQICGNHARFSAPV